MDANVIYKRYGTDYIDMTISLLNKAALKDDIGDKGKRIAIKPNLVCPTPASFGATTHPEIVEGIIRYLRENGFLNIVIMEGSWVGDKTSEAYEYCGYKALCEKYNIDFIDTQKEGFYKKDCKGLTLNICNCVKDVDYLINVPVLKGHCQTKITCALKNMKGLIPNTEKRHFHSMGLHNPIAKLSYGIKQDFIVVDHICGDLDFEEGGNPVKTDCIMVAKDPVLLDSYVCKLLGYTLDEVPYIGLASEINIGSSNLDKLLVNVVNDNNEIIKSFKGSENDPYESKTLKKGKILEVSYAVEESDSCSACYGNLVPALYRLKEEGLLDEVLSAIGTKISIGQGHRQKKGTFGIGNCCARHDTYVKGCPPKEDDIYLSLKNMIR